VGYPTDIISLPSEGYFYPKKNPLSTGTVEVKYLTGNHEEILSNKNLIKKGLSVDIVLKDIIVDKNIPYEDILVMDKEALILASKMLSYGGNQKYNIRCPNCEKEMEVSINLYSFESSLFNFSCFERGKNFNYCELPSGDIIFYKFPTIADERKYYGKEKTDFLKTIILAVNESKNKKVISKYIDTEFLSKDSLYFRKHLEVNSPEINSKFGFNCSACEYVKTMKMPLGDVFFNLDEYYRLNLHEEIFSLCYYGQGFEEKSVYEMPVYKRKLYLQKLKDTKDKENEQNNSSEPKKSSQPSSVNVPKHFHK